MLGCAWLRHSQAACTVWQGREHRRQVRCTCKNATLCRDNKNGTLQLFAMDQCRVMLVCASPSCAAVALLDPSCMHCSTRWLRRDKETGKQRGFAFLAYEDQRSTVLAVDNLSGARVAGRIVKVDHVDNYKVKCAEVCHSLQPAAQTYDSSILQKRLHEAADLRVEGRVCAKTPGTSLHGRAPARVSSQSSGPCVYAARKGSAGVPAVHKCGCGRCRWRGERCRSPTRKTALEPQRPRRRRRPSQRLRRTAPTSLWRAPAGLAQARRASGSS